MSTLAEVVLWGRRIGAVVLEPDAETAVFQYTPEFAGSGFEIAPLTMPLSSRPYSFPELDTRSFHGLPGLLSDSLPDRYGNALIDAWLARQGREPDSFNAVERLCYVGDRGMGALEFRPMLGPDAANWERLHVADLVNLANEILGGRHGDREETIRSILRVGTSAGGARAKAVIAWNPETNEVRSGQVDAGSGFEYWILKFDGVLPDSEREVGEGQGYGAVEYAYHLMAKAAGITMSDCRLFEENGRRHFMSQRFDRTRDGRKIHMQSLGGIAHLDFNLTGAHSYEQALRVIRRLDLPMRDLEKQYRRAVFNIVARNQDDHVKNIAFFMDRSGRWSLSPAFDVTYSYNPSGTWTSRHQMSFNGKRDGFEREDFRAVERGASLKRGLGEQILEDITAVVQRWPEFATQAGLPDETTSRIGRMHRTRLI